MTDRTTKAILLAIALGLWMNAASSWLKPATAHAQSDEEVVRQLKRVVSAIEAAASDVDSLERIARGTCTNTKIC